MTFKLPELPYSYDALNPIIDTKTMEIHHWKHHSWYTKKLNAALEETDYQDWSIEDLLSKLNELPEDIRTAVQNNGGWFRNHKLFWEIMTPGGSKMSDQMSSKLSSTFGSVDEFYTTFSAVAWSRFGSGWAWLVSDADKSLSIISTANQDNPMSQGLTPILGLDVREHAYYLNYQNRRPDYIKAWMDIIHWEKVEELLNS